MIIITVILGFFFSDDLPSSLSRPYETQKFPWIDKGLSSSSAARKRTTSNFASYLRWSANGVAGWGWNRNPSGWDSSSPERLKQYN